MIDEEIIDLAEDDEKENDEDVAIKKELIYFENSDAYEAFDLIKDYSI